MSGSWEKTACILCECNCGLEVQIGGEGGRHFTRIRGDKAHPASKGYACEKPHRLDYYQNGPDRITSPLRRRDDGSFEEIDWDTAIREVAARLGAVRDEHGARLPPTRFCGTRSGERRIPKGLCASIQKTPRSSAFPMAAA